MGVGNLEIQAWNLVFRICDLGLREGLVIKVEPKEQFLNNIMCVLNTIPGGWCLRCTVRIRVRMFGVGCII